MAGVTVTSGTHGQSRTRQSVSNRLAALSRAVDGVRARPRLDVRQVMLFTGAIAMGLGLVAIVLGWYGASHSAYLFQEIPYLISGGLLGVALVSGGGFLFFAAWFVRMIEENRRHASRVAQTLDNVDRALTAIASEAAAAAGFPPQTTNAVDSAVAPTSSAPGAGGWTPGGSGGGGWSGGA